MFKKYTISVPEKLWASVRSIILEQIEGSCLEEINIIQNSTTYKNDMIETKIKNIPLPFQIQDLKCTCNINSNETRKDIKLTDLEFFIDNKKINLYDENCDMVILQIPPFSILNFEAFSKIKKSYIDANFQQVIIYGKPGPFMNIIYKYPKEKKNIIEILLEQIKSILTSNIHEIESMQDTLKIVNQDYIAYMLCKYCDNFTFKKEHVLNNYMHLFKDQSICNLEILKQDIQKIQLHKAFLE